jgi:hypothetical protein
LELATDGKQILRYPSLETSFQHPPAAVRPMPLWWLNGTLTPAEIQSQLQGARDQSGLGGVAPLPLAVDAGVQ